MANRPPKDPEEERMLCEFIKGLCPREPRAKIYRKEELSDKYTPVVTLPLDAFSESEVRDEFGPGTYLLRTIRSNGTWGPSGTIMLGARPLG